MSKSNRDPIKLFNFVSDIPKTEIHLHIEAVASVETYFELTQKNGIELQGIQREDELYEKMNSIENLEGFVDVFLNVVQQSYQTESDFRYLMRDAQNYFFQNKIYYAEVFFAPSKFIQQGMEYGAIVEIFHEEIERIKQENHIDIRLLIDVSRTFGPENAMKNLDMVLHHPDPYVIGIGLGGSESRGPAREFEEVFKKARDHGLHTVSHAGEDAGPDSIWDSLRFLKSERIGHGISATEDPILLDYLITHQIPLEICPTSNLVICDQVTQLKDHPIKSFYDQGICVTVNTDDPTIFGIELIYEYLNLIYHCGFSINELIDLVKNNLFATFLSEQEKAHRWSEVEPIIQQLLIENELS